MNGTEFLFDAYRGITGEAAWAAYEALGGDGLTTNAKGWVRRSCPAHESRSGNSLVFKIDTSAGTDRLVVFDHAGCTPKDALEAAGVDVSAHRGLDGLPTEEWLRRGARRPAVFPRSTTRPSRSPAESPRPRSATSRPSDGSTSTSSAGAA